MFSGGFRTCSLISFLIGGGMVFAAPATEVITPPGWSVSQVAPSETLASIGPCKVGDNQLAAVDSSGQAVLVEPLTGLVKQRLDKPNGAIPAGSFLRSEDNFLFVTMKTPTKVEVDVCDLTTAEWKPRFSADVSDVYSTAPVALYYQDELRLITGGGILLRWKADDQSPLATLTCPISPYVWNTPSEDFRPVGAVFGDSFCAGIMRSGLVLEKDGVLTVKSLPTSVYPWDANARIAVTKTWMTIEVNSSVFQKSGRGLLIWNRNLPDAAPVLRAYNQLPHPIAGGTIWQDRYLLQQIRDTITTNLSTLRVIDLGNPTRSPLSFPLDMGNPSIARVIGMSGDHFWMYEKNTSVAAIASGGHILKSRLAASTDFVKVHVTDASVPEASGSLQFKVAADRILDHSVTVELATRDGTARGGSDFTAWSGTVTLTPASPSIIVSITVLPDKKPETYESLSLDVISCTGAWVGRSSATGLIWDSSFRKLPALPPLPGESYDWDFYDWALVPSGVVKYATITKDAKRTTHAIRARPGDKAWQFLNAPIFPDGWGGILEDTFGDVVCFARKFDLGYESVRVVDVSSDRLLGSYNPNGRSLALSDDGIVFFRNGTPCRLEYHRFDSPGFPVWTTSLTATGDCKITRYGNGQFIHSDLGGLLYVRNFSDGSLARVIQPRSGEQEPVPVASSGDDCVIVTTASDFSSVASPVGTNIGLRATSGYLTVDRNAWITGSGVTGHGVGWYPSKRLNAGWNEPDYHSTLVDRASGIKVGEIESMRQIRPVHAMDGMISYAVPSNRLEILQTWMPLPEPASPLDITAKESDKPVYLEFDLSETVDFSITAKLVSTSPDVGATAPVVVSPGSKTVRIPLIAVRDSIPEKEEVFAITLHLSGDGVVTNHAVTVTVPANDHTFLSTPKNGDIIAGNAVALHPSGLAIGNKSELFAVDYRYNIAYPPDRASKKPKPSFGHTVALDSTWFAVGAPLVSNGAGGREMDAVFVYDRKSGKEKYVFSSQAFYQAFGSVLRFDKGRLVVGAPGIDLKGSVSLFALENGLRKKFVQPGKSFKRGGFGSSVAIRGNYLWVGAPGHLDGRVFQFDVRSGKLVREFKPPEGYQAFGHAMEIVGSRLAVSAPRQGGKAAVFLYNINTGKAAGRIESPFPDGGCFGASLAVLEGKVLVVGCPLSEFSPVGGILLHDLSGWTPEFVTMLCPPPQVDWHDTQHYVHLGATASLSGAENVLGVTLGARKDVLNLQQVGREVILVQLTTALKAVGRMAPPPTVATNGDPWEKALGEGASADDCLLRITTSGEKFVIVLPPIASVETGTRLVLEKSPDLARWKSVAVLEGGDTPTWKISIGGLSINSLSNMLELPMDSPAEYFRIRCEAP